MLGKRKRETTVSRRMPNDSNIHKQQDPIEDTAADVFKKYFEAKFDPLSIAEVAIPSQPDDGEDTYDSDDPEAGFDGERTDSEWSGISEDDLNVHTVEIVDHAGASLAMNHDTIDKIFQKTFMGPKPPSDLRSGPKVTLPARSGSEDEAEEKMNLKHDLDLQRLLRESHLLEQTKKRSDGGAQRHKATELRLQSLGSKVSLFTQEKMPMSHRKGMSAKASSKESHRRKEARENGIVLEKPSKKSSAAGSRRERGVDVPVVGKFKDGILQLSRRDVASIQGPRRSSTKRGRR